jgi:thioredoxin-like negative regulator of GroEL
MDMDDNATTENDPLDHANRAHRSIEDNYPEYLAHEYGYAYEVADVMSQTAIVRHEELLHSSADELQSVDPASLDDFQTWAVARRWRGLGDAERFFETCRAILDTQQEHPVVNYSEISRWLAQELASASRLDEAAQRLDTHLERWPSDVQAQEMSGVVDLLANEDDDSKLRELVEAHPEDAELRFEIAEDLWGFQKVAAARRWLEEARKTAMSAGDQAVLVDIKLLASRIADTDQIVDAE